MAAELLSCLGLPYQSEVPLSRYSVDFFLPDYNLAIEVNGEYWHTRPEQMERDQRKQEALEQAGIALLVLWDTEPHLWWKYLSEALKTARSLKSGTCQ